jgi:hypothetical protein
MTKNQSLFFRVLLFLAGAGIVLLSFFLITAGKELTQIDMFIWVYIGIIYLVFWTPFFFSYITIGNFSAKIPRISLVWLGIVLYTAASVVLIALLANNIIAFNAAVIAAAVLLFIFALDVYFAFFTSEYVTNVAKEEKVKLQYISEIKTRAQIVSLSVKSLPARYENENKILVSAFEEIKYISPAPGGEDLELKIISALNKILELCNAVSGGGAPSGLDSAARELQMLVKERKLLRN